MLKSEFVAASDENSELKRKVRELTEKFRLAEQRKDQAEKQVLVLGDQKKAGPFGTVKGLRTNPSVVPDESVNPRLAKVLEKVAVNKEIIVSLANSNVKEMLEVWFTNIKRVGIPNYLVVALDEEIARYCEANNVPVYKRDPDKGIDSVARTGGNHAVSDRDPRFASKFWRALQTALGTRLHFSTAFHPQTNGPSERTIQTLEDMLRACALQFRGSWDKNLSLMEFAYNNSFHSSIGVAPFEALYGRQCRTPLCWNEVGERELCGPEIIHDTNEKIKVVRDRLTATQSRQKSYANVRRKDLEFQVGDWVFLKLSPWKGVVRFGKRGKLSPRYIRPYEIIERVGSLAYRLALPSELSRIHNVFHVSMLRKYIADPSHVLEEQPISLQKDLSYEEEPVQILDWKEQVFRRSQFRSSKCFGEATNFCPILPGRRPAAPARRTGPVRSVSKPAAVLDRWQPPERRREGGIDAESPDCRNRFFTRTPSSGRHSRRALAQKEALLP
ncbi:hypothetical protein ACLB2K_006816 [Fragaria x ananassa]